MEGRAGFASDEVLIVLGHRDPTVSDRHLLGAHGRHRVRHAEQLARRGQYRAVILSGTGDAQSEAAQMAQLWSDKTIPLILEEQSKTTAENAAYCLPIVLKLQGVRRVTVVSCNWHLRTKYFFSEYRSHGINVSFRPVGDGAPTAAAHLVSELRACRHIKRQKQNAYEKARAEGIG